MKIVRPRNVTGDGLKVPRMRRPLEKVKNVVRRREETIAVVQEVVVEILRDDIVAIIVQVLQEVLDQKPKRLQQKNITAIEVNLDLRTKHNVINIKKGVPNKKIKDILFFRFRSNNCVQNTLKKIYLLKFSKN